MKKLIVLMCVCLLVACQTTENKSNRENSSNNVNVEIEKNINLFFENFESMNFEEIEKLCLNDLGYIEMGYDYRKNYIDTLGYNMATYTGLTGFKYGDDFVEILDINNSEKNTIKLFYKNFIKQYKVKEINENEDNFIVIVSVDMIDLSYYHSSLNISKKHIRLSELIEKCQKYDEGLLGDYSLEKIRPEWDLFYSDIKSKIMNTIYMSNEFKFIVNKDNLLFEDIDIPLT